MAHGVAPRNIIIPLDASDHSFRAFQWYLYNLRKPGDAVVFVHIVEPHSATSAISIGDTIKFKMDDSGAKNDAASRKAKELIQKYVKLAEDNGVRAKGEITIDSKPGEGLVRTTQEQRATMVIIGNRGIGSLRRTILGSTSDFLISHVNVPVIIVPPPK